MTFHPIRSARFARNFWWLGALTMPLLFNLILVGGARLSPQIAWQFDIDGTRRDLGAGLNFFLFTGNAGFFVVTFFSALLAFFVLNKPCHARRAKIWLLAVVGTLFWGALLSASWRFEADPNTPSDFPPAFSIDVLRVAFLGLPLLWSLSLIPIALKWREDEQEE